MAHFVKCEITSCRCTWPGSGLNIRFSTILSKLLRMAHRFRMNISLQASTRNYAGILPHAYTYKHEQRDKHLGCLIIFCDPEKMKTTFGNLNDLIYGNGKLGIIQAIVFDTYFYPKALNYIIRICVKELLFFLSYSHIIHDLDKETQDESNLIFISNFCSKRSWSTLNSICNGL